MSFLFRLECSPIWLRNFHPEFERKRVISQPLIHTIQEPKRLLYKFPIKSSWIEELLKLNGCTLVASVCCCCCCCCCCMFLTNGEFLCKTMTLALAGSVLAKLGATLFVVTTAAGVLFVSFDGCGALTWTICFTLFVNLGAFIPVCNKTKIQLTKFQSIRKMKEVAKNGHKSDLQKC